MSTLHTSKLAKGEPGWDTVDPTTLPATAFARTGEAETGEFPHHWVTQTGRLYLHKDGLSAAWASAIATAAGKPAILDVLAHLRKHFAALGMKEVSFLGFTYDVTEFDSALIRAGYLTEKDLEIDLGAMSLRITGGE